MVEGTCLENKRGATHREFESRPLRQAKIATITVAVFV